MRPAASVMTTDDPMPSTTPPPTPPLHWIDPVDAGAAFRDHIARALLIADSSVQALVQSECASTTGPDGMRWFDTAPLLDVREYAQASCDVHAHALAYGFERRLLQRHPDADIALACAHLVRLAQPRLGPLARPLFPSRRRLQPATPTR